MKPTPANPGHPKLRRIGRLIRGLSFLAACIGCVWYLISLVVDIHYDDPPVWVNILLLTCAACYLFWEGFLGLKHVYNSADLPPEQHRKNAPADHREH